MKKLIALLLLTLSASAAMAQHHGYGYGNGHGYRNLHGHHGHHGHSARGHVGGGWGWAVPAAIGGLIVYQATRPQSVVVQPPPWFTNKRPLSFNSHPITAIYKTKIARHGLRFKVLMALSLAPEPARNKQFDGEGL